MIKGLDMIAMKVQQNQNLEISNLQPGETKEHVPLLGIPIGKVGRLSSRRGVDMAAHAVNGK